MSVNVIIVVIIICAIPCCNGRLCSYRAQTDVMHTKCCLCTIWSLLAAAMMCWLEMVLFQGKTA